MITPKKGILIAIATIICISLTSCSDSGNDPSPTPLQPANGSPTAMSQEVILLEGDIIFITLEGTDRDGEVQSYQITTDPLNGVLSGEDGNRVYTPTTNFRGNDSFQFTVTDDDGFVSSTATVLIAVYQMDPFSIEDLFFSGTNNRDLNDVALDDSGLPTSASPTLRNGNDYLQMLGVDAVEDTYINTTYVGAFNPDDSEETINWTNNWSISLGENATVWEPVAESPTADDLCPDGTTDIGDQEIPDGDGEVMDLCQLGSRYREDLTLTSDNIYVLASGAPGTVIGNGDFELSSTDPRQAIEEEENVDVVSAILTIEPGTLILGSEQEALIISRGSMIMAVATADNPIVMTSQKQFNCWVDSTLDDCAEEDGTSLRGEWAGLVLMGYADSNECEDPCNIEAGGDIGRYGGIDDADNSGQLNYIVIRNAGVDIDDSDDIDNGFNGLTFFATGSATRASFIQVHKSLGDGLAFFGSTTFIDHIVLTDNGDDGIYWGQGFTGGAQFVLMRQDAEQADRGIEADNNVDNPNITPVSMPAFANMTFIGVNETTEDTVDSERITQGILFRNGTGGEIWNSIFTGFNTCLDIDGAATFDRAGEDAPDSLSGDLVINNSILSSCDTTFDEDGEPL